MYIMREIIEWYDDTHTYSCAATLSDIKPEENLAIILPFIQNAQHSSMNPLILAFMNELCR